MVSPYIGTGGILTFSQYGSNSWVTYNYSNLGAYGNYIQFYLAPGETNPVNISDGDFTEFDRHCITIYPFF